MARERSFKPPELIEKPETKPKGPFGGRVVPPPMILRTDADSSSESLSKDNHIALTEGEPVLAGESQNTLPSDLSPPGPDDPSNIESIDVSLIDANRFAPRTIYVDSDLQVLADSLLETGQLELIHVIPNPEKKGRFIIGDGWSRVQAVRTRGILDMRLEARIHFNHSEEAIAIRGWSSNEKRRQHTDFDKAQFFSKLRKIGKSWDEIAKELGGTASTLRAYSVYDDIDQEILSLVQIYPDKLSVRPCQMLNSIAKSSSTDAALKVARQFVENNESFRWLQAKVEAAQRTATNPKPRNSVNFQRVYGTGVFKNRANGVVEITGTIADPVLQTEFKEKIDALLSQYFGSGKSSD